MFNSRRKSNNSYSKIIIRHEIILSHDQIISILLSLSKYEKLFRGMLKFKISSLNRSQCLYIHPLSFIKNRPSNIEISAEKVGQTQTYRHRERRNLENYSPWKWPTLSKSNTLYNSFSFDLSLLSLFITFLKDKFYQISYLPNCFSEKARYAMILMLSMLMPSSFISVRYTDALSKGW